MNQAILILLVLTTLLLLGVILLYQDARNRRIQRQLSVAVPVRNTVVVSNQFRPASRLRSKTKLDRLLLLALGYEADAPRTWPVSYVAMISGAFAIVITFASMSVLPFWLASIAGCVVGCMTARTLFLWLQRSYADRLLRQLPDTIELIVSAVRAGLPVAEAFRGIARDMPEPTGRQFSEVVNDLTLGRTPDQALHSVFERTHVEEYAMFSVTVAVQSRAGGGLAETLQTLGDTVRQRVALAGRAKALAGEAKLSARVLSSLPFVAGCLLYFERHDALDPLFHEPRGRILLMIGLTSLGMGILTMRRMIRKGTTV